MHKSAVSTSPYRLFLFGTPRLQTPRELLPRFRTAPTASLIAYLALNAGIPHSRDKLIALIWPDAAPSAGRNSLSVSLHYLRGLLQESPAGNILIADRTTVTLHDGAVWTDVAAFEQYLRDAGRTTDIYKRDSLLDDALDLYQGVFMEGHYTDWVRTEQERLAALQEQVQEMRFKRNAGSLSPNKIEFSLATGEPQIARPAHNAIGIPNRLNRFFARETEIARLLEYLQHFRLVTLTGAGGVGKTRLAEETARRSVNADRRVVFVGLTGVATVAHLYETIACVLGIEGKTGDPLEMLRYALTATPTLLVLDNLEHLLPGVEEHVERLLTHIPTVVCLATSRKPLKIEGERVFPVTPLSLPQNDAPLPTLNENPTVALFTDRARAVRPEFRVTERNREAVIGLCRALEGIPLAVELAAARSLQFTPEQMRTTLSTAPERLLSRQHHRVARHRSLMDAIAWSYDLLSPEAQRFLAELSVFVGGWTAEAAAAITGEPHTDDLLAELADASLIQSQIHEEQPTVRFSFLETIRAFARQKLSSESSSALREKHAAYYLEQAEAMQARLYREEHKRANDWFEAESKNLFAALETLRPNVERCLRLATAMLLHWQRHYPAEGMAFLSPALRPMPDVSNVVRADALIALYCCHGAQGREADGEPARVEAIRLYREIGDMGRLAHVQCFHANRQEMLEGLATARQIGDSFSAGYALARQAGYLAFAGETEEADRCFAESLEFHQRANSIALRRGTLFEWGYTLIHHGEFRRARPLLLESARLCEETNEEASHPLHMLASVEIGLGNYAEAERHAQRSAELRRTMSHWPSLVLAPLDRLVRAQLYQGKVSDAETTLREMEERIRAMNENPYHHAMGALYAEYAWSAGKDIEALAVAQEADTAVRARHNDPDLATCDYWRGHALINARTTLAHAECRLQLYDSARQTFGETLAFRKRCRILGNALRDMEGIAVTLWGMNDLENAATLLASCHTLRLRGGTPLPPPHANYLVPIIDELRAAYPHSWRTGTRLILVDAITFALSLV